MSTWWASAHPARPRCTVYKKSSILKIFNNKISTGRSKLLAIELHISSTMNLLKIIKHIAIMDTVKYSIIFLLYQELSVVRPVSLCAAKTIISEWNLNYIPLLGQDCVIFALIGMDQKLGQALIDIICQNAAHYEGVDYRLFLSRDWAIFSRTRAGLKLDRTRILYNAKRDPYRSAGLKALPGQITVVDNEKQHLNFN